MAIDNLTTWDINETNMAEPSASLISDGYAEDAIPTSANVNWILHFVTANRIPVGMPFPWVGKFTKLPYGFLPGNGDYMGNSKSTGVWKGDQYEELFIYIWENWPQAKVLPSRGLSAQDDWNANKKIQLYAMEGITLVGQKTTGGSIFSTLGSIVGEENHQLTTDEIPPHSHQIQTYIGSGSYNPGPSHDYTNSQNIKVSTDTDGGNDQPHNNVQPSFVCNYIIKW